MNTDKNDQKSISVQSSKYLWYLNTAKITTIKTKRE